jgi:hypothetical protein
MHFPFGITFMLPMMSRAGGPRVTVEMANQLLMRGYNVNIACQKVKFTLKSALNLLYLSATGKHYHHWGHSFLKKVVYYNNLAEAQFPENEIVIAVGSKTSNLIKSISGNFIKVRFCHGFDSSNEEYTKNVWSGDIDTIAVSQTLVPRLEEYSQKKVMAVVPNGIRKDQYFTEDLIRDGIGMIYETHPNKAPEHREELIKTILTKWPEVPLYIFGACRRPSFIPRKYYWQFPSINKSRELYNRAKIWLIPSRMEGLPGPVLEAMACGAAVVSTDNLGSAEIIKHEVNGYMVPVDQPESFLKYIDLLLNNESERLKVVDGGFKTVDLFTWERAVEKMEHFLNMLIEKHRNKKIR